ncbi:MAG: hypothetical protein HZB51_00050 [Chloroflexi bacterium]|nr:hypothetical protein [Chloroflexota bacterium]
MLRNLSTVESVANRANAQLSVMLVHLETGQLVRRSTDEDQVFMFKHALVQDAAYQSLLQKQRRVLHALVAQTIETLYPDQLDVYAAVLAGHYSHARDDTRTVVYSILAGDVAMRLSAFAEARLHYNAALDALTRLPDDQINLGRRVDTLIKLTNASAFADDPALNYARLIEAEKLATRLSETEPNYRKQLAHVYYWRGFISLMLNDTRETMRSYQQSRRVSQEIHLDQLAAQTTFDSAVVLNVQGRFGEAEPMFVESIELMQQAGKPIEDVIALAQWGVALAGRGQYARGLEQAQISLARVQRVGTGYAVQVNHLLIGWIHFLGGEWMRALESLQTSLQLAHQGGDWIQVFTSSIFIAWISSRLGQSAAAQQTLAQIQPLVQKTNARLVGIEMFMAAQAEIALGANQIDQALALAEQTVAASQANDALFSQGIAQRVWAQARAAQNASWDDVEAHLQSSLDAFAQGDARIEMARTQMTWGKLLLDRTERESAKNHFEQAAAQFEISELTRELKEARAFLSLEKT